MCVLIGGLVGPRRCREAWGSADAGLGGSGFHRRQGGVLFGVAGSSRIRGIKECGVLTNLESSIGGPSSDERSIRGAFGRRDRGACA